VVHHGIGYPCQRNLHDFQMRVGAMVDALGRGRARMAEADDRSAHVAEELGTIVASFATAKVRNANIV
jgi:hypothetical protein